MRVVTRSAYRSKDKRTAEGKPQLEHRHFAVVANVVKQEPNDIKRSYMANHLANGFERTNKKFDRLRFLQACGAEDDC